MGGGRPFIDTNILVYAFGRTDPRWIRASEVLASGGVISVQVLNEFANVARNKLRWEWPVIADLIAVTRAAVQTILPLTEETHDAARHLAERYKIAFYDALLVASAHEAKCDRLFTEDLQHSQQIDGLTIVNPFL